MAAERFCVPELFVIFSAIELTYGESADYGSNETRPCASVTPIERYAMPDSMSTKRFWQKRPAITLAYWNGVDMTSRALRVNRKT